MKSTATAFRFSLLAALTILSFAYQSLAQPRLRGINCFGGEEWSTFHDVYYTTDGGYVMCGYTRPSGGNNLNQQIYVVKCTGAGEESWAIAHGERGANKNANTIIELDNGDFAVGGGVPEGQIVFRLSPEGEIVWSRTYGDVGCYAMIELKEGDLMLCGLETLNRVSYAYLMRLNAENGEVIWDRTYDQFEYSRFRSLKQTDGGVVAAGQCRVRGPNEQFARLGPVLMGKFELNSNPIWLRTYQPRLPPDYPTEEAWSMASHPRGFVLSGIRREEQGSHYKGLTRLVDSDGEIIWTLETALENAGVFFVSNCKLSNNDIVNVGQSGSGDGHPFVQWLTSDGEERLQVIYDVREFGDFSSGTTKIISGTVTANDEVVICGTIRSNDPRRGWEAYIMVTEPFAAHPILTWTPEDTLLQALQGDTIRFTVTARDALRRQIDHLWLWNESDTLSFDTTVMVEFDDLGSDTVRCDVTNGEESAWVRWRIYVRDLFIVSHTPDTLNLAIRRGTSVDFSLDSVRYNGGEEPQYLWTKSNLDNQESEESGRTVGATIPFLQSGNYSVEALAYRGESADGVIWNVAVRGAIWSFRPEQLSLTVQVGEGVAFDVYPFNPDTGQIVYSWFIDGHEIGSEPELAYQFNSTGVVSLSAIVTEAAEADTVVWTVDVTPLAVGGDKWDAYPTRVGLLSVSPNPFNSMVRLTYSVQQASLPVRLAIHDIAGREVAWLVDNGSSVNPLRLTERKAADHRGSAEERSVTWDASAFPAGIYFARLEAGVEVRTVKMVLVR